MKKIAFILSLLFLAYSLSMCKNIFSATSDTVNETYLSLVLSGTGQTTCYDAIGTEIPCAGTGQDGEYRRGASWPSPRFIDNGNGTVTDRLTGLMWQQNGSASGIVNWQGALNYVSQLNNERYLGYADWRLPNVNELISLMMHYGQANLADWLNTQGFNNSIQSIGYWSSTTSLNDSSRAWCFWTSVNQPISTTQKNIVLYAIAVRGNGNGGAISIAKTGQTTCYEPTCTFGNCLTVPCAGTGQDGEYRRGVPWPSPRFTDNGNGTVTDRLTGLIWVKDGNLMLSRDPGFDTDGTGGDGLIIWQSALNYIAKLNQERYLGYLDWRLPNVSELRSLLHYGQADSAAWLNTQGFSGVTNDFYWSGSTYVNETLKAFYVQVNTNSVGNVQKTPPFFNYVLAVRGGY